MSVFEEMGPWGYCKPCHRLVLLRDDANLLRPHTRVLTGTSQCAGSDWPPYKDIPAELTAEQERKWTGVG